MLKINKNNKLRLRGREGIVSGQRVSQRNKESQRKQEEVGGSCGAGSCIFHSLITHEWERRTSSLVLPGMAVAKAVLSKNKLS